MMSGIGARKSWVTEHARTAPTGDHRDRAPRRAAESCEPGPEERDRGQRNDRHRGRPSREELEPDEQSDREPGRRLRPGRANRRSASRSRRPGDGHDDEDREVVVSGGLGQDPRDAERRRRRWPRSTAMPVRALESRADQRRRGLEEAPREEHVRGDQADELDRPQEPDVSHEREHRPEQQLELRARPQVGARRATRTGCSRSRR